MKGERIVELCSVANDLEAHALCALLEEAGIPFRIVGELLGTAAGSLPLGEATAPRIWVWERDAARAPVILAEQRSQPAEEEDEEEEYEAEDVPDGEDAPLPSDVRFRWLSQGFVIAGVVCIVAGAIWAWFNWMTMQQYAGTAEGVPVGYVPSHLDVRGTGPPPPIPLPPERLSFSVRYDVKVAYVVDGKTYGAISSRSDFNSRQRADPFDLRHPADHITGSLTPPRLILAFALAAGAFLSFVGYQFR